MGASSCYRVDHRRRDGLIENRVYLLAVDDDRTACLLGFGSTLARWHLKLGEQLELVREDTESCEQRVAQIGLTTEGQQEAEGLDHFRLRRGGVRDAATTFKRWWPVTAIVIVVGANFAFRGPAAIPLALVAFALLVGSIIAIRTGLLPRIPPPDQPRDFDNDEWTARVAADAILRKGPFDEVMQEVLERLATAERLHTGTETLEMQPALMAALDRGPEILERTQWLCAKAESEADSDATSAVVRSEATLRAHLCIEESDLEGPAGVLLDRFLAEDLEQHRLLCRAAGWCRVLGCHRPAVENDYCIKCAELGAVPECR